MNGKLFTVGKVHWLVRNCGVVINVLVQGSTKCHVDQLNSSTNRENWFIQQHRCM